MPSFLPEPVRFMICGGLEAEYDKLKKAIDGFVNALIADISGIELNLGSINTPLDDLMGGLKGMLNELEGAVPKLSDVNSIQAILRFIQACTWLKDHSRFSDAYNLMKSLYDQFIAKGKSFLSKWNIPGGLEYKLEFDLGSKLNGYADKLKNFKLGEKMASLNGMLMCIEAICALDEADNPITEIMNGVNAKKAALAQISENTRTKMDGSLDKDKVYNNGGMNKEQKFGMNRTLDALKKVTDAFEEAHANTTAAVNGDPEPYPATEILTHLNDPSFISTSLLYDSIDPDIEYKTEFLETWNNLTKPSGTTTKKGNLDVIVEIASCNLNEKPDPDVNCYAVYTVLVNIIIGFRECHKIIQTAINDENNPTTVKHYNHGMSTGQIISISDSTHGFDGDYEINVLNDDTFTFICSAPIGEEQGVKISLLQSGEGEIGVGNPICGECFKYTTFGLTACNDTQKSFIRKYLAKAINEAINNAMNKYTAENLINQLI